MIFKVEKDLYELSNLGVDIRSFVVSLNNLKIALRNLKGFNDLS